MVSKVLSAARTVVALTLISSAAILVKVSFAVNYLR
jgi:hypothetical protein